MNSGWEAASLGKHISKTCLLQTLADSMSFQAVQEAKRTVNVRWHHHAPSSGMEWHKLLTNAAKLLLLVWAFDYISHQS